MSNSIGSFSRRTVRVSRWELVAGQIKGEITELELWGRKSPGYSLTCGTEMMLHDPQRSNRASNLGIYTTFTPSLQNLHCNP
jgi:hypothetical protein